MKRIERKLAIALLMVGLGVLASWKLVTSSSAQVQSGQEVSTKNNSVVDAQDPTLKEAQRRQRLEKKVASLVGKTKETGFVRVIVHPRGDFKMSSELLNEGEMLEYRNRVAYARDSLANNLRQYARGYVKTYSDVPFIAFDIDESGLQMLKSSPDIENIEEDVLVDPVLTESVPLVGAPSAWNLGYTGAGQSVAIADTGVDKYHPLLVGKVVKEACFSTTSIAKSTSTACPNGLEEQDGPGAAAPVQSGSDSGFHGTHVAAIAAGYTGVAKGAKIVAIQVFSKIYDLNVCKGQSLPCLKSFASDQAAAATFVANHFNEFKIASLNFSLASDVGYTEVCDNIDNDSMTLSGIINTLRQFGVATVIASGNTGFSNKISFPACISPAVRVGATDKSDKVASFSNSSSLLDLLAPGVNITSAIPGSKYATWSGTSMAAPHVAGAFAILKSKAPFASVVGMEDVLKSTGKKILDPKNQIIKPRIDVGAAAKELCSVSFSPASLNVDGFGGKFQFDVKNSPLLYCSDFKTWKVTGITSWIHLISPTTTITGNGTVKFSVDKYFTSPQDGMKVRTGFVYVNGKQFKVTQYSEF